MDLGTGAEPGPISDRYHGQCPPEEPTERGRYQHDGDASEEVLHGASCTMASRLTRLCPIPVGSEWLSPRSAPACTAGGHRAEVPAPRGRRLDRRGEHQDLLRDQLHALLPTSHSSCTRSRRSAPTSWRCRRTMGLLAEDRRRPGGPDR